MQFNEPTRTSEDEEPGRILSDGDYALALKNRDDIFRIEKAKRLRTVEAITLVIGVLFGAWLSTTQGSRVAHNYHRFVPVERTARLVRAQNLPADVNEHTAAFIDRRADQTSRLARPEAMEKHRAPARTQSPTTSNTNLAKKLEDQKPAAPSTVSETPIVVQEEPRHEDAGLVPKDATENDSSLVMQGNAFKKQGNHASAMAAYDRVLARDPHNFHALAGKGDLYLYTGLLDSAVAFYTAASAVNPRIAAVHNGLGSARYYLSTLAANPYYTTRMNIADPARYRKAQYDSAIAEYTNAFSLDSSYVEALTNRGVVRDLHNDRDAAIADYTLSIKINPSYADAYAKRAETYQSLGDDKKAVADFSAAIKLGGSSYEFDPTLHFANAYFGRGNVYYGMREYDKAIADFDSTLALSPKHSLAILNRAIALDDERQYDSAIAGYTRAIALLSPAEYNGAQRLAYLHRGNAYKSLGKYDQAIADYTSALESPKYAAKACWRIADCFSLKNQRENAIAWLKKSVSYGFKDFSAWNRDRNLSFLWGDKEFRDLSKQP